MINKGQLKGQVAVVTGGGRGIGRAIAERLAAEGVAVAVVARSADQLADTVLGIERAGGKALAATADVTKREQVEKAVERVEEGLGPISLLVNNAGSLSVIGPTWEVDADGWWRDVEVTLRGAFLCSRSVLREMIQREGGRIVNVTSLSGARPSPYTTSYACAKAALFRLSEGLAEEGRPHGVRVFTIRDGCGPRSPTASSTRRRDGSGCPSEGPPRARVGGTGAGLSSRGLPRVGGR